MCVMAVKEQPAQELTGSLERLEGRLRDAEDELQASRELAERFAAVAEREGQAGELGRSLLTALGGADPMTAADIAEYLDVSGPALRTFLATVFELLGNRPLSEDAARRGALVAVSQEVWENELGALLSSAQARELLGGVTRQRVDEMLRSQRLVGLLDSSGRRRYPAFQFRDGRPLTDLIDAFWVLAGVITDWSAAAWCTSPDPALDDRTPVEFAAADGDRDRLMLLARRDAARLAQ
jgi:hypothetical protein